jgi:hypothetical protein
METEWQRAMAARRSYCKWFGTAKFLRRWFCLSRKQAPGTVYICMCARSQKIYSKKN